MSSNFILTACYGAIVISILGCTRLHDDNTVGAAAESHGDRDNNRDPRTKGKDTYNVDFNQLEWLVGDWVRERPSDHTTMKIGWVLDRKFIRFDIVTTNEGSTGKPMVLREVRLMGRNHGDDAFRKWIFDNYGLNGIGKGEVYPGEQAAIVGMMIGPEGEKQGRGIIRRLDDNRIASIGVDKDTSGDRVPASRSVFERSEFERDDDSQLDEEQRLGYVIGPDFHSDVSSYEMLQPLEWLVGDWTYEESERLSGMRITRSSQWILGRAFLQSDVVTKRRSAKNGESTTLRELIIIGWDHRDGVFRQWTFNNLGHAKMSEVHVASEEELAVVDERAEADGRGVTRIITLQPTDSGQLVYQAFERYKECDWVPIEKPLTFERLLERHRNASRRM